MADHAQAVVIGGGVVGASVLYHLTRAGWTDVVLLERSELTAGSTWHSAGGMHALNADPTVAKLQHYTIELYREIEAASGQDCSIHVTGGVSLADTPERLDWLKTVHARGRYLGIQTEMISAAEAARRLPIVDPTHFVGAMADRDHGHVDPAGVTHAYVKAAVAAGAQVRRHTWARSIVRSPSGRWRIGLHDTSDGNLGGDGSESAEAGSIETPHVVNAGGLWAREVGRMVGLELPVLAMEHIYVLTEPIPEVIAHNRRTGEELIHCIDFGGEIYLRQEGHGLLLGTYEQLPAVWQPRQTPWDFDRRLLPPDLERIAPSLRTAFAHFPVLADAGIAQVVNGPFTFAPDGNPLVGPVRGLLGYWSACAVMAGLSQGGGVGLALANWMTRGDPGFDVWAMDIARFGDWATRPYVARKVIENYRRRFSIRFPNEYLPEGRPLATTPIYDTLRARGAVFGDSFGVEVPLWFAPRPGTAEEITFGRSNAWPHVREEVQAVRHGVGLMESSGFAKFLVEGPGARAWLNRLVAARLPAPGRIALAPMCGTGGKLAGDLTVACLPPAAGERDGPAETVTAGATANTAAGERFVIFGSGVAERYYERWFDAALADWTRSGLSRSEPSPSVGYRTLGVELCGLAIAGPASRALLAQVTDADVSEAAMRFGSMTEIDIGMARVWCGRLSYTGALGYELWVSARYQRHVFGQLVDHGAAHGLRLFGSHALNSLRLEKSFGSWAREYRPDYDPFEAGLGRFVRLTRPDDDGADFVGRAALVARYGPSGVRAGSDDPAEGMLALRTWTVEMPPGPAGVDATGDEPIWCNGKPVGWVTSGGYAHHSDTSLAMGYVPAALATKETDFEIELLGTRRRAHLVDRCLWDPDGIAMRA
ncbi:MAG: FAD-dependent oxidoreductase [Acidimicrobiia bacterium]|nr:FAD-dependent oxidoreductase [Acidimicrobiia bacterium]